VDGNEGPSTASLREEEAAEFGDKQPPHCQLFEASADMSRVGASMCFGRLHAEEHELYILDAAASN